VIRAFKTEACGVVSIVFAGSASQARWTTLQAAREVGYKLDFGNVSVLRAPEYDVRLTPEGRIPSARMCHAADRLEKL